MATCAAKLNVEGQSVDVDFKQEGAHYVLRFAESLALKAGQELNIQFG